MGLHLGLCLDLDQDLELDSSDPHLDLHLELNLDPHLDLHLELDSDPHLDQSLGHASSTKDGCSLSHPLLSEHFMGAEGTITPRGVHQCPFTLLWAAWGPSGRSWGLQQCDRSPDQGAEGRDEMAAVPLALAVLSGASGAERAPRRSRGQGGG